jgi:hypothetical protein
VTAAAVILIILGALGAIGAVLVMIGGGAIAGTFGGGLGGIVIVIGVLVLAYAVFEIISGVKVLGLSNGWRIAGIVLAAIGAVFAVFGLISAFSGTQEFDPNTLEFTSGPNIGGIITNLIGLALYVLVIVLLARNSRAFTR